MLPPHTVFDTDLWTNFSAIAVAPLVDLCPCASFCNALELCRVPDVDLDTGGLPCVDYSNAGKRACENGKTGPIFVTWSKRHKTKRTKVVVLENAKVSWLISVFYMSLVCRSSQLPLKLWSQCL